METCRHKTHEVKITLENTTHRETSEFKNVG
jgi:hypothetical protein